MVMLRRIKIHRFGNVVPGCEIELSGGINILLGQNGTGKTTLLEWIAGLMSGRMEQWKDEPYEVELELEAEDARAVFKMKNTPGSQRRAGAAINAAGELIFMAREPRSDGSKMPMRELDLQIETPTDRYHFRASSSNEPWTLEHNGKPQQIEQSGFPGTNPQLLLNNILFFSRSLYADHQIPEWYRSLVPPAGNSWDLPRFDESLGVFSRVLVTDRSSGTDGCTSFKLRDLDSIYFDIHIPELGSIYTLFQSRLKEQLSQAQESGHPDRHSWTLRFRHDELPFLALAVEVFGYQAAEMSSNLVDKQTRGEGDILTFGRLTILFTRRDGSIINHNQLSYGQKRMLAFFWYLSANPHLIIVDELVNGLHHAWIERAIEQIGERQAIMTSQNPLLLDYLSFESVDEVRKRFVLCRSRIDEATGREQLIWRNPTEDEAASVFSAYQAGIQHVGEILRDKGLW